MPDLIFTVLTLLFFGIAHLYVEGCDRLKVKAEAMIENILLLVLSIALMVYLVYALLRPEKF